MAKRNQTYWAPRRAGGGGGGGANAQQKSRKGKPVGKAEHVSTWQEFLRSLLRRRSGRPSIKALR